MPCLNPRTLTHWQDGRAYYPGMGMGDVGEALMEKKGGDQWSSFLKPRFGKRAFRYPVPVLPLPTRINSASYF